VLRRAWGVAWLDVRGKWVAGGPGPLASHWGRGKGRGNAKPPQTVSSLHDVRRSKTCSYSCSPRPKRGGLNALDSILLSICTLESGRETWSAPTITHDSEVPVSLLAWGSDYASPGLLSSAWVEIAIPGNHPMTTHGQPGRCKQGGRWNSCVGTPTSLMDYPAAAERFESPIASFRADVALLPVELLTRSNGYSLDIRR
jgi:hypothetical protein